MGVFSAYARNVRVALRHVERNNPCSYRALPRQENTHHPIACPALVEVEPSAGLPALTFTSSLDAHANEAGASLHCKIIGLPAIGHFRGRPARESELANRVMLAGIPQHLRRPFEGN